MHHSITSFVVRFQPTPEYGGKEGYRIKVTHVQLEIDQIFDSFEAAMRYMKKIVDQQIEAH